MYIYRKGILIVNLRECRRLVTQNKSRAAHQQCEYLQTWERKVISTVWLNTWSITKWSHDMEARRRRQIMQSKRPNDVAVSSN